MTESTPRLPTMTWKSFVRATTADANAEIGRKIGITGASVGRWFSPGSLPSPEAAASFARAYGRPVLESFIAAGFLTPEEADERPSAAPSLTSLTDDELLTEVARRMRESGTDAGTAEAEEKMGRPDLRAVQAQRAARKGTSVGRMMAEESDRRWEESQDDGSMEPSWRRTGRGRAAGRLRWRHRRVRNSHRPPRRCDRGWLSLP